MVKKNVLEIFYFTYKIAQMPLLKTLNGLKANFPLKMFGISLSKGQLVRKNF